MKKGKLSYRHHVIVSMVWWQCCYHCSGVTLIQSTTINKSEWEIWVWSLREQRYLSSLEITSPTTAETFYKGEKKLNRKLLQFSMKKREPKIVQKGGYWKGKDPNGKFHHLKTILKKQMTTSMFWKFCLLFQWWWLLGVIWIISSVHHSEPGSHCHPGEHSPPVL